MIETFIKKVNPNDVEYTIHSLTAERNTKVSAMTTITNWQPLPNVPKETVIIVFEREIA